MISPSKPTKMTEWLWQRYLGILFDGLRPEGAHPLPQPPPRLT